MSEFDRYRLMYIAMLAALILYMIAVLLIPNAYPIEPRAMPKFDDSVNTQGAIELGRKLAFDARTSRTQTHSCMTCHRPEMGYTEHTRVSAGATGDTALNAPTLLNSGYKSLHFHNGRAEGLEGQASQPLESLVEMGQGDSFFVVQRLSAIPEYQQEFRQVFGRGVNQDDLFKSLAAFQRTLISSDAPIDRAVKWRHDGARYLYSIQPAARWVFDETTKRGFDVFFGRGQCIQCHQGPDYRTDEFANNGMVAYRGARRDQDRESISDRGRDDGCFAVPTLREIHRTHPYGHAGHLPTLESVVEHYVNVPGDRNLDRRMLNVDVRPEDRAGLIAFLRVAFAGEQYPHIEAPMLPPTPPGFDQLVDSETRGGNMQGRFRILRRRR